MEPKKSWRRSDIVTCNCEYGLPGHVHCPCFVCCYKAVHRSTEYRHWKELSMQQQNKNNVNSFCDSSTEINYSNRDTDSNDGDIVLPNEDVDIDADGSNNAIGIAEEHVFLMKLVLEPPN